MKKILFILLCIVSLSVNSLAYLPGSMEAQFKTISDSSISQNYGEWQCTNSRTREFSYLFLKFQATYMRNSRLTKDTHSSTESKCPDCKSSEEITRLTGDYEIWDSASSYKIDQGATDISAWVTDYECNLSCADGKKEIIFWTAKIELRKANSVIKTFQNDKMDDMAQLTCVKK